VGAGRACGRGLAIGVGSEPLGLFMAINSLTVSNLYPSAKSPSRVEGMAANGLVMNIVLRGVSPLV
jgi:hypothetical protein